MEFEVRDARAEEALQDIGQMLKSICPPGYIFVFLLGGITNKNLFYASNGDRQAIINAMKEFIAKFEEN